MTYHDQLPARVPTRHPHRKPPVWLVVMLAALLVAVGVVVLVGVLSGTGVKQAPTHAGELDDAARLACDDFATGYPGADSAQRRVELARKVNGWARSSRTERVSDLAADLARVADGSASAWQVAADGFAQRCVDAGWKAR